MDDGKGFLLLVRRKKRQKPEPNTPLGKLTPDINRYTRQNT